MKQVFFAFWNPIAQAPAPLNGPHSGPIGDLRLAGCFHLKGNGACGEGYK